MRVRLIAAVAAFTFAITLAVAPVANSQTGSPAHKKVFGYQDSVNGSFHALNHIVPDAATTPTTGTVELIVTITLKTALPKGGSIACSADLTGSSTSLSADQSVVYEEEATTLATVSGSTASCTVTIPYSWVIPAASSTVEDLFEGGYTIEMIGPTSTSTAAITTDLARVSGSTFVSATKIPATGTISKYTIAVTL